MSSKTDAGDRGKWAAPTKPNFKGYKIIYQESIIENKKSAATRLGRVTFSGLTEYLEGHIHDMVTVSQANQFTSTTKALVSYAGRKCTNPQDIRITIKHQKEVIIPIPVTRMDIDKDVAKILLRKDIDASVNQTQDYRQNKANMYSMDLGQCTEAMKNTLEGEETYESIDE